MKRVPFCVFELKRAVTTDKAIGQVTRYMGWVMENLTKGKPVYGIIVARGISGLGFRILFCSSA